MIIARTTTIAAVPSVIIAAVPPVPVAIGTVLDGFYLAVLAVRTVQPAVSRSGNLCQRMGHHGDSQCGRGHWVF